MGGFGWHNPFPFELGGGETDAELAWRALRSAVGGGGPVDGLEDVWRQIKAVAIAASGASVERAFLQFVPGRQTDALEAWENVLGLARAATLVERQAAVASAITLGMAADHATIDRDLKRIDGAFALDVTQWAQAITTIPGKLLAPRVGTPPYGSGASALRRGALLPNYATSFVLHVEYALPFGSITPPAQILEDATRYLNSVLPAWEDYEIHTGVGFYLDGGVDGTSLLDLTAFG